METLELKLIEKRLSKYSVEQLNKKMESDNFNSPEEKNICAAIIEKRSGKVVENKKVEGVKEVKETKEVVGIIKKELTLLEEAVKCLDELYEKNDIKINKRVLAVLGDEDVDDYSELSETQLATIIQIHKEIFHPELVKPIEVANKEVKKEIKKEIESKKVVDTKKSDVKPKNKGENKVKGISRKKMKSLVKEGKKLVLIEENNRIEKESEIILPKDGVKIDDNVEVSYHKGEISGIITGMFNGVYEKDIVIIVKPENNKAKWIMQKNIKSITLNK